MNKRKNLLSAAVGCLLIFSVVVQAAVLVDDTFQDANSQNQLLPESIRLFNGRAGTIRTDAQGAVTFNMTSTSSEGFWGFFTDGGPVTLNVGDRFTVSATFSLQKVGPNGGTDMRFGVFDSQGTRTTANLTGGINSPTFADDTGYAGRLAGTTGTGNPFTLFHRVAPGANDPLINATTPLPSSEYIEVLGTSSTPRQALTNDTPYTFTYEIERLSDTSTRLTASIVGGAVNINTTGIETSATPHTTFDWFGFRIPGTNFASHITFTQWYANYTPAAPVITTQPQPSNLNVQVGSDVILSVGATGSELTFQWRKNGEPIIGNPTATTATLQLNDVQIGDSGIYDVVVTNSGGSVTSTPVNLTVTSGPVDEPPIITDQPDDTVVTIDNSASLSVTATGTNLTYQWFKNGVLITGATGPTLNFPNAQLSDTGRYSVVVTNSGGSVTSDPAQLTVVSEISMIDVEPPNGATNVCIDAPLRITFDQIPVAGTTGTIRVFRADGTLVDTIDLSADSVPGVNVPGTQAQRSIGGASAAFNYYPIIVNGNTASIYLRQRLEYDQTYYVTIDAGAITDESGAPFTGISDTITLRFTTRAQGPAAGANRLTVSADGRGDFCTVQGAVDFVPTNNTQRVTIFVRNGVYEEIVYVRSNKRFITVRGESRSGTMIRYANNENLNPGTLARSMFGVDAADFHLRTITLHNTTSKLNVQGNTRQAEAFRGNNDRILIDHVNLKSFQDTLLLQSQTGMGGFVNETYIEGDVDFTWGAGTAYFRNCELKDVAPATRPQAYYSQVRNPQGKNGNVYLNCRLTRSPDTPDNSAYLSRIDPDDFPYSQVVFIDTLMDRHIRPEGWLFNNPSLDPIPANYPNIRFWEYNSRDINTGAPIDVSQRHPLSRQMTAEEAAFWRNPINVIGWKPDLQGTPFDFDGDGRADISVFRPSDGTWYIDRSSAGFAAAQFGLSTDRIVPADYDGDGITDIAVYRDGTWYVNQSSSGFAALQFGVASDIPQPADYDGDGRAEFAVFRAGTWYTYNLATNQTNTIQFGLTADKPVVGDYDGDGIYDPAIYRPSEGVWWYLSSVTGNHTVIPWGIASDVLVPADYDGDGKTDAAVFREGVWWINGSTQGTIAYQFGVSTDIPVPADYDGDGRADIAVYRDGVWYISGTTSGIIVFQFGLSQDVPAPAAFVR